jgi:hypothetical protein
MRFMIMLVALAAIVGGALISTSHALMPAKNPVSFSQRWAPVDAALQSGQFVVEQRLDD